MNSLVRNCLCQSSASLAVANFFLIGNTTEGVQEAKNIVAERLLAHRVSEKVNAGTSSSGVLGSRLADVMARIHVAQPGQVLPSFIPEAALAKQKYSKDDPSRPMLSRDVESMNGGAGVFNVDLKADYMLENPEWKYDKIPEIFDGKNIYDFVDPDIEAKLQALEEEEEKLEAEGYYDSDEEIDDVDAAEVRRKADQIRTKQALIRNEARMRRIKNRAALPRSAIKKPLSQLEDSLDQLGVDTEELQLRGRSQTVNRSRSMSRSRLGTVDSNAMEVDQTPEQRLRSKSRMRDRSQIAINRRDDGVTDTVVRTAADRQAKLSQRKMNRNARQGEADRHTTAALARHLVSSILCTHPLFNGTNMISVVRRQAEQRYRVPSLKVDGQSSLIGHASGPQDKGKEADIQIGLLYVWYLVLRMISVHSHFATLVVKEGGRGKDKTQGGISCFMGVPEWKK